MDEIYLRIRARARKIVAQFPPQKFYQDFSQAEAQSRACLDSHPILKKLNAFMAETAGDNLGHGLGHALKVTIDAGTLMIVEGGLAGYSQSLIQRRLMLVQCSGLLHDAKRRERSHARKGAEFARQKLRAFPELTAVEIQEIADAIGNHEAFKEPVKLPSPEGNLLSDCLYDADKFRWGPDNFTHTVWDMLAFSNIPFETFVKFYSQGINSLVRIKSTFRTTTGKQYGPEFIDTGLAIGEALHEVIQTEFGEYC